RVVGLAIPADAAQVLDLVANVDLEITGWCRRLRRPDDDLGAQQLEIASPGDDLVLAEVDLDPAFTEGVGQFEEIVRGVGDVAGPVVVRQRAEAVERSVEAAQRNDARSVLRVPRHRTVLEELVGDAADAELFGDRGAELLVAA